MQIQGFDSNQNKTPSSSTEAIWLQQTACIAHSDTTLACAAFEPLEIQHVKYTNDYPGCLAIIQYAILIV